MERYVNFYTDFAFKKFFGTEANQDLLISFLNALLGFEGANEIRELKHLNTEQLGSTADDRRAVPFQGQKPVLQFVPDAGRGHQGQNRG